MCHGYPSSRPHKTYSQAKQLLLLRFFPPAEQHTASNKKVQSHTSVHWTCMLFVQVLRYAALLHDQPLQASWEFQKKVL